MSTSVSSKSRPSACRRSSPSRASSQRWQSGRAYSLTSGEGIEVEVLGVRDRLTEAGGRGDHGSVVRAGGDRRGLEPEAELVAKRLRPLAQLCVRSDPAPEGDRGPLPVPRRPPQLGDELTRDRGLEGGGEVRPTPIHLARGEF